MVKNKLIPVLASVILATSHISVGAQAIKSMEFRGQDINDILMALAQAGGVSIVPDETVNGTASYYFADTDFTTAFQSFLAAFKLYARKDGSVWYVSRVGALWDPARGLLTLDAEDVDVQLVIQAASRAMGRTILYDALPRETITIHASALPPERVVEILGKRFSGYTVEYAEDHFYIKRMPLADARAGGTASKGDILSRSPEGLWSIDRDSARLIDILEELFRREGKEFSLLMRADATLERLRWKSRPFEDFLRLVLEQANADYAVKDDVWYFFEIQRKDVLKKLKETEIVRLRFLSVQDLSGLLPADLSSGGFFRVDKASNSVILSGSAEETGPIKEFIASVDLPGEGLTYYLFQPAFIKAKEAVAMLPAWLAASGPVLVPDGTAFLLRLSPEQKRAADAFIASVDAPREATPVRLRYIRTEDLLKTLPPSVAKEDLVDSGDPSTVFFVGRPERLDLFRRELEVLDRPKPQIRYDILVVQYQRNDSLTWQKSLDARPSDEGDSYAIVGALSKLVSLNFDVVAEFGYLFAAKLSLELGNAEGRIFADTTLTGLSGHEVKFQNTSTFRYRDTEIDPDTGTPKSTGVTRELTSGLIIGVNGWVSGDGMVTMDIQATISKRGADTSTSGANPPPTSERVVSSHLRTASGDPIILSGLIQRERTETVKKIPILGDIPWIGSIFRDVVESEEETELVIYIIPRIMTPSSTEPGGAGLRMERLWRELFTEQIP
ncbi:MAG: hypothetical protein JXA15_13845 [Spirochaetales bacterium]|nr:hypothetical protein [Spirochaetales bacterium]